MFRRYDDLHPGATFPDEPAAFHVTAEVVDGYRAIADGSAADGNAGPPGEVPPTLAALYIRGAQNALRGPPGGIHAKQHFTFHRPVRVGDMLRTTLTVLDKYERNGRRYVVSETRTTDAAGQRVATGRITAIWGRDE